MPIAWTADWMEDCLCQLDCLWWRSALTFVLDSSGAVCLCGVASGMIAQTTDGLPKTWRRRIFKVELRSGKGSGDDFGLGREMGLAPAPAK